MDRIKIGLHVLADKTREDSTKAVKLTNISAMEIHAIRRFFTESLDLFTLVGPRNEDGEDEGHFNDGSDVRQKIGRFR